MKKVIDILDSIQEVHCTEYANKKIDEAINELKELENRSCGNCKHFIEFDSKVIRDCCNILNVSSIGGCGDYWEKR